MCTAESYKTQVNGLEDILNAEISSLSSKLEMYLVDNNRENINITVFYFSV